MDCSSILKEIDERVLQHNSTLSKIAKQLSDSDKQASETQLFERDVQDNQKARSIEKSLHRINEELTSYQESLSKFNQKSIKKKFEEYNTQYDHLVGEVTHHTLMNLREESWIDR